MEANFFTKMNIFDINNIMLNEHYILFILHFKILFKIHMYFKMYFKT